MEVGPVAMFNGRLSTGSLLVRQQLSRQSGAMSLTLSSCNVREAFVYSSNFVNRGQHIACSVVRKQTFTLLVSNPDPRGVQEADF